MKIIKLGPNMTEVLYKDGTRVLFSYETPVAAQVPRITMDGGSEPGVDCIKSDRYFSRTTSGHVSKWLDGGAAAVVKHDEILRLTEGK